MNGQHEFCNGSFTIWGGNTPLAKESLSEEELDGEQYNGVIGCNCFFRKSAVVEVGGFDEYYAYFLDETDLCLRIAQAGYSIVHHNKALVLHEAAGGANRKSQYHLNWDVIAKSRGYFVIKASEGSEYSEKDRVQRAIASGDGWMKDFKWMLSEKKITKEDYNQFVFSVEQGLRAGIQAGLAQERKLDTEIPVVPHLFKKYLKTISKPNLNICFLCEDDILKPLGGTATYTSALAYGLSKLGHNVYVITKGEDEIITNKNGVNLCYINPDIEPIEIENVELYPISKNRLNFSYHCFVKLQELKQTFFIDVLETPIWDTYGLVCSYLEKKVPMVTRLQTPLKMVIDTFQKEVSPDHQMLMEYEAAMLEKSDAIIPISDCIKDTIENLYEMKFMQPVYKNYLGFSPEATGISTRDDQDGKIVVFFIGRLERRKGIDSIIATIPELMDAYPGLEFRLAGDCEIFDDVIGDTYKNKLLKENRGAKWLKRVKFLGKISDEEKEQEFANCDVFVSPSLYESFGIIFVEAMRYGKPMIGCRAGGMPELIVDGETGLLCEPGNAADFKACLERLIQDPQLRQSMGAASRARMEQMFTEQRMCEETEKIYREVVRNGKK